MMANNKKLEIYTLDQIKDEFIGKIGTEKRIIYEKELKIAVNEEKPDEVDRDISENWTLSY